MGEDLCHNHLSPQGQLILTSVNGLLVLYYLEDEYYNVQDEYMYLGDECQHLQVLPSTLGRLMTAPGR